ncbi:d16e0fea-f359-4a87-8969-bbcf9a7bd4bd [Sclerotinia trifoliorum]|uniref:D16e0fea-f359-4a87-8969-bbcf9a7bd4bd n=1 Tax=Sclerotinia trifoliorum TaxID=28548 RepID=A0A8H2W6L5_9HELO|nr:d16e0fea-f359-4a87-8969-bbcf9a7bd4bd [Sclerotinia trifoliorum]
MPKTSDASADAAVPSRETEPKVSGRKTTICIKWLACILVLIIGALATEISITSSYENVSYQPSGSPRFAEAGNYRACQENKAGPLVRKLMYVDEQKLITLQRGNIEAQLSDIRRLFSHTVYPALEQLLQSEALASDKYDDFSDAIKKARTTLSIDTERKTAEIKKIARSLEKTIQSPPDPKEWWWRRLAITAKKESFAKTQIEDMQSLYRAHQDTTMSTISQIPQLGHTAEKAHRHLREEAGKI